MIKAANQFATVFLRECDLLLGRLGDPVEFIGVCLGYKCVKLGLRCGKLRIRILAVLDELQGLVEAREEPGLHQ